MPKSPRMTSAKAESILLKNGYQLIRSKGSHRIYMKHDKRIVIPFHKGKILHPKIMKQVMKAIE